MTYYDDSDKEDDFGKPVPKRSQCDEEDKGNESSDHDMPNDMEYIYFMEAVLSLN